MNLLDLAEADNSFLLEDASSGFGRAIALSPPNLSVAVAAVLTLSVDGVDDTALPSATKWVIDGKVYTQGGAAVIASGAAIVSVTADVAGAAGNQDDGESATPQSPIAGVTAAEVAGTTTIGVDKLPDTVYNLVGQYMRVGVDIDPETGQLVQGNKSAVTIRLSSIEGGALPAEGWTVTATDSTGASVHGKASVVMLDRTAGRATIIFKR